MQDLKDVSTMYDDAIGWAEDAASIIEECFNNDGNTWHSTDIQDAYNKTQEAISLLRSAQRIMKPAVERADREFWQGDKS